MTICGMNACSIKVIWMKLLKRNLKMSDAKDIMKTDVIFNKRDIRIQKAGRRNWASGVTLIEVMVATAILVITMVGISGYRYCSSMNARCSEKQITAARVGQLLCGSWAGVKGSETFDLKAFLGPDLLIETLDAPTSLPDAFVLLGKYRITIEGFAYDCELAWNDVTSNLRALWIRVGWEWRQEDPTSSGNALKKSFTIITYVTR
jgi:prepilin-type N-terminal cleavage/methylation domain-containing protein